MRVFVGTLAAIGAAVAVFAFARSRGASSLASLAHGHNAGLEEADEFCVLSSSFSTPTVLDNVGILDIHVPTSTSPYSPASTQDHDQGVARGCHRAQQGGEDQPDQR
jgi:hypothetical protein